MGYMPDLTVTNITWSPTSPVEGNSVYFTATVKNSGNGSTPNGIPINVNFAIGSTVVSSGSSSSSLASNGTVNITATAPWTAVAGTNTVTATVDPSNTIAELNETNNTYSASCVVSPLPGADFIITGITASPSNPSSGTAVSFIVTVKNRCSMIPPMARFRWS